MLAADHTLAAAGPDPALAHWLRDVFWQVAWAVVRGHRRRAIALTTMDIKRHTKALQVATATHKAAAVQMRHLATLDQEADRYLEQDLHPWLRAARQHEANLLAALDDHAHAQAQWRHAAGQLLADVRHDAQAQTSTPVPGTPGRARRRGPLPITS